MPLLGFTLFKQAILDGSKKQTIRKLRKHPVKCGEKLYLYWHARQKDCELLGTAVCKEAFRITMMFEENFLRSTKPVWRIDRHYDDGNMITLTEAQCEELAKKDGFDNALGMMMGFSRMHPNLDKEMFQVIRW